MLKLPKFRKYIWRRLQFCGIYETSYRPGESGSDMAFREGARNVGLDILNEMMEASPDAYAVMSRSKPFKKVITK